MQDIFQEIKELHKKSNILIKKNVFYYSFFKLYHSRYKEKLNNFFMFISILIFGFLSLFSYLLIEPFFATINISALYNTLGFFVFILILFGFGFIFMKLSKIVFNIKNNIIFFIINRIENSILKHSTHVEKQILNHMENIFFFPCRTLNEIENSLKKSELLHLDVNFSKISQNFIYKINKLKNIENF